MSTAFARSTVQLPYHEAVIRLPCSISQYGLEAAIRCVLGERLLWAQIDRSLRGAPTSALMRVKSNQRLSFLSLGI